MSAEHKPNLGPNSEPNPAPDPASHEAPKNAIDLVAARATLASAGAPRFWQGLQELSGTPEYRDFLENEFPYDPEKEQPAFVNIAAALPPAEAKAAMNRRDVLKLAAASAAMAGLSACTKLPTEKIVPYVKPPEEIIPGKPLFYATSMTLAGVASGLLVESNMGRPTKIEGNPEHPGSLGGTDVFSQASVLGLYDPDRSQTVIFEGRISNWGTFLTAIGNQKAELGPRGGGVRILTETVTSPTLTAQIQSLLKALPDAKWHQYEPFGRDNEREGARLAFGRPVNTVYRVDQADVIVSLDSDFLTAGSGHVRYAREFASRRTVTGPDSKMNRLYVVEPMPTATGASADHRWPLRAADVAGFARQLASGLGVSGASGSSKLSAERTAALVRDLQQHRGSSLIVAGELQPPEVHALAHAMNAALGNVGKTLYYTDPLEANSANQWQSLQQLADDLEAQRVALVIILGGNPVYDAPVDLDFGHKLLKANMRVHSGLYYDETGELCNWHVPAAHYLESWSDARAYDGTIGIIQPLISPLYDGHTPHEIIGVLTGDAGKSGHDIVHDYWKGQRPEKDKAFEAFWERSLHDGIIAKSALPPINVSLRSDAASSQIPAQGAADASALEINYRPDPCVFDGRFTNNGWLQELPKPNTRLTWDNAAMMSAATAQRLGLEVGDNVMLQVPALDPKDANHIYDVKIGVWVVPGHADDSVTVHTGYGRRRAGNVGTYTGSNANFIRRKSHQWVAGDLRLKKTGDKFGFAVTQHQYTIDHEGHKSEFEGVEAFRRDLVRVATFDEFKKDPDFAKREEEQTTQNESLFPPYKYEGYAWGMSIDLNKCVGCNACVVACQSENNIPVVGKEQVMRGRAMHWIRIDTYFRGGLENPEAFYEPVLCMHCENAPCELVCPVGATVHSAEGLNEMVYNRCVGTRYCSNNCPYKVRRFNFLLFSDWKTPSLYGLRNPNVTVRSRGVMEKCSYCVQRINAAKIRSEEENRHVRDGEIVTACEGACPAEAIRFGNINDSTSRVAKLKAQSRNYWLLDDLNTKPRTTYLARVKNPNPEIKE